MHNSLAEDKQTKFQMSLKSHLIKVHHYLIVHLLLPYIVLYYNIVLYTIILCVMFTVFSKATGQQHYPEAFRSNRFYFGKCSSKLAV